eukprot:TRINITY_DN70929_c0_g1_i1.p1 TRINITY_DN70929_c0_g1~~TRINITY_DN70929_c0_g1_i1.p1  ORF type:complete len:306 (+),score=61.87 TRINITY_DN70929_c0_g1_i1:80-997(+)
MVRSAAVVLVCCWATTVATSHDVTTRHDSAGHGCNWDVWYDRWIDTFEKREFEPAGEGAMHCLEECCRDPSCQGLQIESSLELQCYKYRMVPTLEAKESKPMGDAKWLKTKQTRWSIVVKAGAQKQTAAPASTSGMLAPPKSSRGQAAGKSLTRGEATAAPAAARVMTPSSSRERNSTSAAHAGSHEEVTVPAKGIRREPPSVMPQAGLPGLAGFLNAWLTATEHYSAMGRLFPGAMLVLLLLWMRGHLESYLHIAPPAAAGKLLAATGAERQCLVPRPGDSAGPADAGDAAKEMADFGSLKRSG